MHQFPFKALTLSTVLTLTHGTLQAQSNSVLPSLKAQPSPIESPTGTPKIPNTPSTLNIPSPPSPQSTQSTQSTPSPSSLQPTSATSPPLKPTPTLKPTTSSQSDIYFINRAKNLARQAAINANGGLENYRPNAVMYGPAVQTAYVTNPNGSVTFTFTGGIPSATGPSLETVATVMPNGSVKLDYNGPIRSATGTATPAMPSPMPSTITDVGNRSTFAVTADQEAFLSKARNLARQAAIKENGGLDRYRPEASMFGPSSQAPVTKNPDGSVTFSFKGGAPGAPAMTIESVITVSAAGSVNVQYNGPVR